jgi:hypothetical protein
MKKSSFFILMIAIVGGVSGAWYFSNSLPQADASEHLEKKPGKEDRTLDEKSVAKLNNLSSDNENQVNISNTSRSYAPFPSGGSLYELEKYMSQGIIPTTENINKALDRVKNASGDELVTLTRILARLYDRSNNAKDNDKIIAALSDLARSADKLVASSAAVGLARMGGTIPGVETALAAAKASGALSADMYEGERVWVALSSPPTEQARILGEIAETKNKYATRVTAFVLLGHPDAVKVLEPESKSILKEMVINTEPEFSKYFNEAGLSDLFIYSDWLQLYGKLESPDNWTVAQEKIIERLEYHESDPRAIVAYLYGIQGRKAQRDPELIEGLARITEKANVYFDQFPNNQHIAYLRKTISEYAKN